MVWASYFFRVSLYMAFDCPIQLNGHDRQGLLVHVDSFEAVQLAGCHNGEKERE